MSFGSITKCDICCEAVADPSIISRPVFAGRAKECCASCWRELQSKPASKVEWCPNVVVAEWEPDTPTALVAEWDDGDGTPAIVAQWD